MHVEAMLHSHPAAAPSAHVSLARAIEACFDCAQSTIACSDACLAEKDPAPLARCIRICVETSDIFQTTGRLLSHRVPTHPQIWESQMRACCVAARMCAEECETHSAHHDHCRICAEACRACERACEALRTTLRSTPA